MKTEPVEFIYPATDEERALSDKANALKDQLTSVSLQLIALAQHRAKHCIASFGNAPFTESTEQALDEYLEDTMQTADDFTLSEVYPLPAVTN